MILSAIETHFSEFSWDTVVAFSTLILAFVTVYLGLETRRVAGSTQADVNAQDRPVLLVTPPPDRHHPFREEREGGWTFPLTVRNHGRGPALELDASVKWEYAYDRNDISRGEAAETLYDGPAFGPYDAKTIAVDEPKDYDLGVPTIGGMEPHSGALEITLTYLDIAGIQHHTSASLSFIFQYDGRGEEWYEWIVKDQRVTAVRAKVSARRRLRSVIPRRNPPG